MHGDGHRRLQRVPTTPTGQVGLSPDGPGSVSGSPCTLSGTGGSASCSATFTPSGPEVGGKTRILASYLGERDHLVSSGFTTVRVRRKVACAGRVATIVGRPGADRLRGTRKSDVIAAGQGNDRIGPGGGTDLVCAGPGNDIIFSRDGRRDALHCGPGRDSAIVDTVDRTRHCEIITRPPR